MLSNKIKILKESLEEMRKNRDKQEEDKVKREKARQLDLRQLKKVEDEDQHLKFNIHQSNNTLKKLENEVNGYQVEAQKLTKIITLLQRDQEKYGIEAT